MAIITEEVTEVRQHEETRSPASPDWSERPAHHHGGDNRGKRLWVAAAATFAAAAVALGILLVQTVGDKPSVPSTVTSPAVVTTLDVATEAVPSGSPFDVRSSTHSPVPSGSPFDAPVAPRAGQARATDQVPSGSPFDAPQS